MIYPLAFYSSMHFAGVAIGSVISLASAPLASGLLELLLERKRLSGWWALAAGLGIIGSTLLCRPSWLCSSSAKGSPPWGGSDWRSSHPFLQFSPSHRPTKFRKKRALPAGNLLETDPGRSCLVVRSRSSCSE